jgi:hypothetical protein
LELPLGYFKKKPILKIILFVFILGLPFSLFSQMSFYGVTGLNTSSISFENYVYDLKSSPSISPFLTIGIALPINQKLYFSSEQKLLHLYK